MMKRSNEHQEALLDAALESAQSAALEASRVVLAYWPSPTNKYFHPGKELEISYKEQGVGNFATAADLASGAVMREQLNCHPLLERVQFRTEESPDEAPEQSGPWWNIDEIDGTANFSRGSDHFGISIGLHGADGVPEVGVIAFPARRELIVARRGVGASLVNFARMELVDLTEQAAHLPVNPAAEQLFVAYELGYDHRVKQIEEGPLLLADRVSALKSYHSTSYALGELALGKIDAFFSKQPTIFDIGASSVATEAIGGKVSDMDGSAIDWSAPERSFLAARSPQIHARVLEMLHTA